MRGSHKQVSSFNFQSPSGLGYAIENRLTMNSISNDLYPNVEILKISTFIEGFKNMLKSLSSSNQDNPLMPGMSISGTPVLAMDVWEHAYYLKYKNMRADYIKAWWNVVNWKKVEELYMKEGEKK